MPDDHLLDGEDRAAYEVLLHALLEENKPKSMLETQLLHRLAITLWKQTRADRLEAKLFAATENPRYLTPDGVQQGDPEAHFDLARFNAIRHYQAALARDAARILRELRALRREGAARTSEPERPPVKKESGRSTPPPAPACPANDVISWNEPDLTRRWQEGGTSSAGTAWAHEGRRNEPGGPPEPQPSRATSRLGAVIR
jgi:hypothetical protein